jgi:acyl carrier protein
MDNIEKVVRNCVTNQLNIRLDELGPSSKTFKELGLSKLDIKEIKIAVEDELNIKTPKLNVGSINTINDLIAFIKQQL